MRLRPPTLRGRRLTLTCLSVCLSVTAWFVLAAADPARPSFDLVAVCDPVSRGAQQLGPLLSVLRQVLNADIRLVLNSQLKHSDMPLKR